MDKYYAKSRNDVKIGAIINGELVIIEDVLFINDTNIDDCGIFYKGQEIDDESNNGNYSLFSMENDNIKERIRSKPQLYKYFNIYSEQEYRDLKINTLLDENIY